MPWAPGARMVVALDAAIARAAGGPLIAPGDGALLAVSGGTDSTALAYALSAANVRFGRGWRLVVAHVHHGLRGAAADQDRDFVHELSRRIGAGFTETRVDVEAERREGGGSIEEAARRLRYRFLEEAARAHGSAKVATAHHADDQAETVLMRAVRGTGIRGLGGIPARRPLAGGIEVVRPLLGLRRAEIERYLGEIGILARRDESNDSAAYLRNRVRHEALPLLRDLAPGVDAALVRLAAAARESEALLSEITAARLAALDDPTRIPLAHLERDPPALRALVLTGAVERILEGELNARHRALLGRVLDAPGAGAEAHLPGGIVVRRGYAEITIERGLAPRDLAGREPPSDGAHAVASEGSTEIPALGVGVAVRRVVGAMPPPAPDRALLDAAALEGRPLALRRPRRGDRVAPVGMQGTKKLQDLFVDAKVPRHERSARLLLTVGGEVAWVAGLRVDRRFAAREGAHEAVEVVVRRL